MLGGGGWIVFGHVRENFLQFLVKVGELVDMAGGHCIPITESNHQDLLSSQRLPLCQRQLSNDPRNEQFLPCEGNP